MGEREEEDTSTPALDDLPADTVRVGTGTVAVFFDKDRSAKDSAGIVHIMVAIDDLPADKGRFGLFADARHLLIHSINHTMGHVASATLSINSEHVNDTRA